MLALGNKESGRTTNKNSLHFRRACLARLAFAFIVASSVLACAPQPTQNQPATPANTTQPSPTATSTPEPTSMTEGDITITPIMHASLQIEYGGKVIHVDPTSPGDYSKAKQADLILVTDIHPDHLDPAAISRIRKAEAPVVVPAVAVPKVDNATVIANGENKTIAGIQIEAVPMYNLLRRDPKTGELFHTKGRGNGYILSLGTKRVYIAGDTECTPEMRALKNIDIAFIPMNLPYTMPPSEAAECVKAFKPKVVYPYHYRGQNPEEFKSALAGEKIEVRLANWYPEKK